MSGTVASTAEPARIIEGRSKNEKRSARAHNDRIFVAVKDGIMSDSQYLDPEAQKFFESALGYNFANIKIHDNIRAADSAKRLDADAFSVGDDVVFASGKFKPGTATGDRLIMHELVHTIQQKSATNSNNNNNNNMLDRTTSVVTSPQAQSLKNMELSKASDSTESEATSVAKAAVIGTDTIASISHHDPSNGIVISRQAAAVGFQKDESIEDTLLDPLTIVSSIAVELQKDPRDSAGRIMRKLAYLTSSKRHEVVESLHYRLSPMQNQQLSIILSKMPMGTGMTTTTMPSSAETLEKAPQPPSPLEASQVAPESHLNTAQSTAGLGSISNNSSSNVMSESPIPQKETQELSKDNNIQTSREAMLASGGKQATEKKQTLDVGTASKSLTPEAKKLELEPGARPSEGVAEADTTTPSQEKKAGKKEDKSPASPLEDPAFQSVKAKVATTAKQQQHHAPAKSKAAEAALAAKAPPNEVSSQAAGTQVTKMDAQQPKPFDRSQFKVELLAKVEGIAPKNLEQADEFKKNGGAAAIKSNVIASVDRGKETAQGPIKHATTEAPDQSLAKRKEVIPLAPAATEATGSVPSPAGTELAAPKPKTKSEVSLEEGKQRLDQRMKSADITDKQLQNSNEPQFVQALGAKNEAGAHAQSAPAAYRQTEQAILIDAQAQATATSKTELQSMHSTRLGSISKVVGDQVSAKEKDEKKREEVSSHIETTYNGTKDKVVARLAKLDKDVNRIFDAGAEQARREFEGFVERRMVEYKDKRYSGIDGAALWLIDKLTSPPKEVNEFYEEGRRGYIKAMDAKIDEIATVVEVGLNESKSLISEGRKEVKKYVDGLPENLKQFGEEAAGNIQSKFDSLVESVEQKKDQLIDSLSKKYTENLKKIDERIAQMKEANQGLVNKAMTAVVGVVDTILELKNMLLGVLKRAANAISKIIKDPIGFLGNLVNGVKTGLKNFLSNIGTHLKKGLMSWLFGALAEAGIQLPQTFDLKGILSLVLQVLGLTYPNIRKRAVGILGEKLVSQLEQAAEIFKILITQGPAGLWEHIKEKLGDLKAMVIDEIESFVKEKVLIAGVTWIVSLLNPAAAFIKAAKAIYDIVMFFVTRGSQIISLVNSIIDSVNAIADGSIGVAATAVEDALGKAVPVAIGFLSSLLGLGGISGKIRSIITKIQQPVNSAIDWVINKAVQTVKSIAGFLTGKKESKTEDPLSTAIKEKALSFIQEKVQSRQLSGINELHSILSSAYSQFKAEGLKSIDIEVTPDTGQLKVSASASYPKDIFMKFNDIFRSKTIKKETKDMLKRKLREAGEKTTAALTFQGRLVGTQDSEAGEHAESILIQNKWDIVIEMIDNELKKVKSGSQVKPLEVVLTINRAPCVACSKVLREKNPKDVKDRFGGQVQFILVVRGVYEPTQEITEEEKERGAESLIRDWDSIFPDKPLPSLEEAEKIWTKNFPPKEGLRTKMLSPEEEGKGAATRKMDLESLISYGWDLRVLKVGREAIPKVGEQVAEFIINNRKADQGKIAEFVKRKFS